MDIPMQEIGAFEAKNKLSQLLDRVEAGEQIIITRHGKAVARLLPPEGTFDRQDAMNAVAEIRELRRGVTLGGLKIKDMISEGRM